jgi:membrane fusion protein (multidrug efflux system)
MVNFDPNDAEIGLQSAQANLARTVRQVRGLYSNVDGQKAQVNAPAGRSAESSRTTQSPQEPRGGRGDFPGRTVHARDDLTSAQNALADAKQRLKTTSALVDDTVVSSHPDVMAAAAQLRQAYLNNSRSTLIAPVTGYVAKRTVQLGQRVQPGTALMAVIPLISCGSTPTSRKPSCVTCASASQWKSKPTLRQCCEIQRHHRQPWRRDWQRVCPAARAERHR